MTSPSFQSFPYCLTWNLTASCILPRCTGRCGALATKFPCASNNAHEKSSLSLILVLAEVLYSVIPIYSAIDMNLCPKIDSSIESSGTSSIALYCLRSAWLLESPTVMLTLPQSSREATHLGSKRMVLVLLRIMAGPVSYIPALSVSRSKIEVAMQSTYPSTSKYTSVSPTTSGFSFSAILATFSAWMVLVRPTERTRTLSMRICLAKKLKPNSV